MKRPIRKGDQVQAMRGNDRGKRSKVIAIDTKKYRATVEGLNIKTLHIKPNQKHPKGQRIKKEGSIHLSNLMLVDPETKTPTRIGRKLNEQKKLQRYSKKTGKFI